MFPPHLAQAFFKLVPFHGVSIRLLSSLAETRVGTTFQIRWYFKQVLNFTARTIALLPTPKAWFGVHGNRSHAMAWFDRAANDIIRSRCCV